MSRVLIHADDGSECENFMACQRNDVEHTWVDAQLGDPKPIKGLHVHTRRKDNAQRLADAYDVVNVRDGNESRVSGCYLLAESPDNRQRREHHHLKGRNVRPDWKYDPKRIVLCSAFEHGLLESGAIEYEGDDANERIVFFWNRAKVPVGTEPFRIKSKRWSANEAANG